MNKSDCIVTLSGGIDSTVLTHKLVREGLRPLCVYVDYGTMSRNSEIACAKATAKDLRLPFKLLPLRSYKRWVQSYILGNTKDYEDGSMFWLEGRNVVISVLLAVMASGARLNKVFLGINYGDNDYGGYPDTDAPFIKAVNSLIRVSFKSPVKVVAPWIDKRMRKPAIIKLGQQYGIDWVARTHSCSNTSGRPCCDYARCESCHDRRSDFRAAGRKDPFRKKK